jgi:hypothetical protein
VTPTSSPAGTFSGSSWSSTALSVEERLGERFTYHCPPAGGASVVWGTDTYTVDSSVCTAAVHAGMIGFDNGGDVTIEVEEGRDAYTGSQRNGVSTLAYGAYDSSFVFVSAGGPRSTPVAAPSATATTPPTSGTGSAAYAELLTHIHPTIAATCREIDPAAAGALAVANCAPEDVIIDPDIVIGDVVYVRYSEVGEVRERLQSKVEEYGESLGEDCAAGPAQLLNDLSGEPVGRLLCLEDRLYGGTVVGWWTDERLNLLGSVLLYEGDFADLLNVLDVAQARP